MSVKSSLRAPALHTLEARDVPAIVGTITVPAALPASGLLTITGDDHDSSVQLKLGNGQFTLTPDANTDVGAGPGVAKDFQGTVKALSVDLEGGNDTFAIDPNSDFVLPGAATFDLGDGANVLDLTADNNTISLGSLTYTGGDGPDSVTLNAGTNLGKVVGNVGFDTGVGAGTVNLQDVKIQGSGGLKLAASKVSGAVTLQATNVTVTGPVTASNLGGGYGGMTFNNATVGPVTATGALAGVDFASATVNGGVTMNGGLVGQVTLTDATVTGNVSAKGSYESGLNYQNATITGDVKITGGYTAYLHSTGYPGTGTFSAHNVTVTSNLVAGVSFGGTGKATIAGNLSVTSKVETGVSFNTTQLSEVAGTVSIKGGSLQSSFNTNEFFKADKDVTVALGNGTNEVGIGNGNAPVVIGGKLSITTGGGNDVVTLSDVAVTGSTSIKLGAGSDILAIDKNSVFTGTFAADLGGGDDTIAIAQTTGGTAAVKFLAKATIKAGTGNDELLLGVSGGDAGQAVSFSSGSTIDGGTGVNLFDPQAGNFSGIAVGTGILNWTDPT